MKKNALVLLLVLSFVMGGLIQASAATRVVRKSPGAGEYGTLEDAFAARQWGEAVEIADSGTYEITKNLGRYDNLNFTCTSTDGKNATIIVPATITDNPRVIYNDGPGSIKNINFVAAPGTADTDNSMVYIAGAVNVENCSFIDFPGTAVTLFETAADKPQHFTNDFMVNVRQGICFDVWSGSPHASTTLVDHCTIVTGKHKDGFNYPIYFQDNHFLGDPDGSKVTIQNSILYMYDMTTVDVMAYVCPDFKYNHNHNDYVHGWDREKWNNGAGGPAPLGTGDLDNVKPAFVNRAAGDYRLMQHSVNAQLFGAASDGKNIGADITTVPVELSAFSAE